MRSEAGSTKHFATPRGTLVVETRSAHLITTTMSGTLDLPLAQHFTASIDAWLNARRGNLFGFHDWEAVVDYDSEARLLLTPWTKVQGPKFERIHMLLRSRALVWGLKLVNSVTGEHVTPHHSRTTFDEARRLVPTD